MTPPSMYASLGRVDPELVGLHRKALIRDATRRLMFVVDAVGWLHSMVINGRNVAFSIVAICAPSETVFV